MRSLRYLSLCSGIEAASVAWGPLGWEAVGFCEIEEFPSAVLAHRFPAVPNYGDMTQLEGGGTLEQLTLWSAGLPARGSASPANVAAWPMNVADWPYTLSALFLQFSRCGSSGKMSPELFRLTADGTSGHSSGRWPGAGIISHGECLTLSTSESPSAAVASSLWDILETGAIPPRFYLSSKACAGILRRAKRRRRRLPPALKEALESVAARLA